MRLADLAAHAELLQAARDDARLVIERDPDLQSERGAALRALLYLFRRDDAVRTCAPANCTHCRQPVSLVVEGSDTRYALGRRRIKTVTQVSLLAFVPVSAPATGIGSTMDRATDLPNPAKISV